jgi:F-type H+-transporting ATPase subunit b
VDPFALTAAAVGRAVPAIAAAAESTGLQINLFWIIVATANFLLLLVILWLFAWGPLTKMLDERRRKVEQGLRDAETARRDRELAESERLAALNEARREANEIIARAQRVAQETRDADIAATRDELDRMRERATGEIEAEKQRAIADLRAEVTDLALAAAGRVVGEEMTSDRQRRLVQDFLRESAGSGSRN